MADPGGLFARVNSTGIVWLVEKTDSVTGEAVVESRTVTPMSVVTHPAMDLSSITIPVQGWGTIVTQLLIGPAQASEPVMAWAL